MKCYICRHCDEFSVLGFDCEWVVVGNVRRPVALLQLTSHRGLCALVRLSHLQMIPFELKVWLRIYYSTFEVRMYEMMQEQNDLTINK